MSGQAGPSQDQHRLAAGRTFYPFTRTLLLNAATIAANWDRQDCQRSEEEVRGLGHRNRVQRPGGQVEADGGAGGGGAGERGGRDWW